MKKHLKAVALTLGVVMCAGSVASLAGCGGKSSGDTIVVMTEALNGLFNPFFSTSGTDMSIVELTQIGMLTTDSNGDPACGDDEAVVVKDYEIKTEGDKSVYYFVIKNGIQFSDGVPLTMEDILFNMYVYLDPAYTGSSTMYSTDIVGLQDYRTQTIGAGDDTDDALTTGANNRAQDRRNELVSLFTATGKKSSTSSSYSATEAEMLAAIKEWNCSSGYMDAIGVETQDEAREQLEADYTDTLKLFKDELSTDYDSALDSYTEDPYKSTGEFNDPITCFMYMESSFGGFVTLEYKITASGTDKTKIEKVNRNYDESQITTKEQAINYVYNTMVEGYFQYILMYYSSGTTMFSNFVSKAKDVILHEAIGDSGELKVKNISGIVSMGHTTSDASVTVNGTTYAIAQEHNEDGTPANDNEYDVLRVTVNGTDPKAIWNFGFTVAPYHYYSDPSLYPVDIENNEFGVDWASFDFMSSVLQGENSYGQEKNKLPLGAGSYVATDSDDTSFDKLKAGGFYSLADNFVYYQANENFLLGAPKIKHFRYEVVSSTNSLSSLKTGSVHFVEPQFTNENIATLNKMKSSGIESTSSWQLGYGYVGINAGKVADVNLRKAIMSAMDTSLAIGYYETGTAYSISWPMSLVSWAYPRTGSYDADNLTANTKSVPASYDYLYYTSKDNAIEKVKKYMAMATYSESDLKLTFTIAGASVTEHPLYNTFINAMQILNECGWNVSVLPDTNALTKLSTGSLTVWAAAWGSTVDPDMYQVYHKDSTATSVLAWGYREILNNPASYSQENKILNELSEVIDAARETNDKTTRTALYEEAMLYVLDLAVEMPVYQRKTLYAYNSNVIDDSTFPEVNSYSSPLSRIWELELK